MYKMLTLDFHKVNQYIVGPNSWFSVRRQISKSYFLLNEKNFILEIDSTRNFPGVRFNILSSGDLIKKLNYLETTSVREGIFSLVYNQAFFREENKNEVKIETNKFESFLLRA